MNKWSDKGSCLHSKAKYEHDIPLLCKYTYIPYSSYIAPLLMGSEISLWLFRQLDWTWTDNTKYALFSRGLPFLGLFKSNKYWLLQKCYINTPTNIVGSLHIPIYMTAAWVERNCFFVNDGFRFCSNVTFEDDEFKDNKALNYQGKGEGTNCHSPTQPQHELELDLIMGRNPPPPPPRNF